MAIHHPGLLHIFLYLLVAPRLHVASLSRCTPKYGTDILLEDCNQAFIDLENMSAQADSRTRFRTLRHFSRSARVSEKKDLMPQGHHWGTCSIGIDLTDPAPPFIQSDWGKLLLGMNNLIHDCVGGYGYGGVSVEAGFEFLILNSQSLVVAGTCMAPRQQHGVSLVSCIEGRFRWAESHFPTPTNAIAQSGRSISPPSILSGPKRLPRHIHAKLAEPAKNPLEANTLSGGALLPVQSSVSREASPFVLPLISRSPAAAGLSHQEPGLIERMLPPTAGISKSKAASQIHYPFLTGGKPQPSLPDGSASAGPSFHREDPIPREASLPAFGTSWIEGGAWVQMTATGKQGVWMDMGGGCWNPLTQPVEYSLPPLPAQLSHEARHPARLSSHGPVPRAGAMTFAFGRPRSLAGGRPPAPRGYVLALAGTPREPLAGLECIQLDMTNMTHRKLVEVSGCEIKMHLH